MKRHKPVLTRSELEIMQIIWRRRQVTVRDVYEELLEQRKVAYTTVMTMMGILEEKGYLKKNRDDRAHVYRPAQPKGKVVSTMVNDFVDRVLEGSAKPLLMHLVESDRLSQQELDEVARLMGEKKGGS